MLASCREASFAPSGETMPVVEKFVSVNGEGLRAGRLAAFVRFAGCNLRCSYCDTMWANRADCPVERLTVDDIVVWASSAPAACITLTGGEPALQPLLPQLVCALSTLPPVEDGAGGCAARTIEIETNGSVDLSALDVLRRGEDDGAPVASRLYFTTDWKLPSSGMTDAMRAENFAHLRQGDVVKFVVGSRDDLEEMERIVREYALCERCAVYASPVFGRIEPADIARFLSERQLARVVLQLQLHKIIWPNVEKGV